MSDRLALAGHGRFELTFWNVIKMCAEECNYQAISFEIDWVNEEDSQNPYMHGFTFSILRINKVYTYQVRDIEDFSLRAVLLEAITAFAKDSELLTVEKGWHVRRI